MWPQQKKTHHKHVLIFMIIVKRYLYLWSIDDSIWSYRSEVNVKLVNRWSVNMVNVDK